MTNNIDFDNIINILYSFYVINKTKHNKFIKEIFQCICNNIEIIKINNILIKSCIQKCFQNLIKYKPFCNYLKFNRYKILLRQYTSSLCYNINKLCDDNIIICGKFVSDLFNGYIKHDSVENINIIYKDDDDLDFFLVKLSLVAEYKQYNTNGLIIIFIKGIPRILTLIKMTLDDYLKNAPINRKIYIKNNKIHYTESFSYKNYTNIYIKKKPAWQLVYKVTNNLKNIWECSDSDFAVTIMSLELL